MTTVKVACVQVNARDDMAANIEAAAGLARRAAEAGAALISFPEYVSLMDGRSAVMRSGAFEEDQHPALAAFRDLARELAATLHIGSLSITTASGKPTNRSFLIAPDGEIIARYDKIHMFDILLPDGREAFESRVYQAGDAAVVAKSPVGLVGLSICYDVRFPHLFRALANAGAEIILVPASFLPTTGNDHWHVLMRSRAIDTGAFLVGAAMCGEHGGKRSSFGSWPTAGPSRVSSSPISISIWSARFAHEIPGIGRPRILPSPIHLTHNRRVGASASLVHHAGSDAPRDVVAAPAARREQARMDQHALLRKRLSTHLL